MGYRKPADCRQRKSTVVRRNAYGEVGSSSQCCGSCHAGEVAWSSQRFPPIPEGSESAPCPRADRWMSDDVFNRTRMVILESSEQIVRLTCLISLLVPNLSRCVDHSTNEQYVFAVFRCSELIYCIASPLSMCESGKGIGRYAMRG
jgi:hypothetical protein